MNTKVIKEKWGENHERNSESSQSIQQARIKTVYVPFAVLKFWSHTALFALQKLPEECR